MTELGGSASGRWYNPTSGQYTTIAGSPFANTGSRTFTTPGNNGTGTNDWLLVLEVGGRNHHALRSDGDATAATAM